MTIASTVNRVDYVGNGSTATYAYSFHIFSDTDLLVLKKDLLGNLTTLGLTADYTVTGVDEMTGGTIVLTAGNLASGVTLTIKRVRPLLQDTDIRNQGDFFPEVIEDTFDKLLMIDQQQQDAIDSSIRLPAQIAPSAVNVTLPVPSPNQVLGWNPSANALVNVAPGDLLTVAGSQNQIVDTFKSANSDFTAGSTTSLTLSQTPGAKSNVMIIFNGVVQNHTTFSIVGKVVTFTSAITGGTTVVEAQYMTTLDVGTIASENATYIAALTGAVTRNVRDRLRDVVNAKDYGALGDGLTDDTSVIQACINHVAAAALDGCTIFFPPGKYLISNITIPPEVTLQGSGAFTTEFFAKSGSTGYMFTDQGNAAKIILKDFAIFGQSRSYDALVRLGYGSTQWGTSGCIMSDIIFRDNPTGVGIDLNANVGVCRNVSGGNCDIGIRAIGNSNFFSQCAVAGYNSYGIYAADSFWHGLEIESNNNSGSIPVYLDRQVKLYGLVISLSPSITCPYLFQVDASASNCEVDGLVIYTQSGGSYTAYVSSAGVLEFRDRGRVDGSAPLAGRVGELLISSVLSNTSVGATTQYFDATSKDLTAGCWDVEGTIVYILNGATMTNVMEAGVGTVTGNDSTGLTKSLTMGSSVANPITAENTSITTPTVRVNISATTTYYLKGMCTYSAGTPKFQATLRATRVA